jgi:hypothetical protein
MGANCPNLDDLQSGLRVESAAGVHWQRVTAHSARCSASLVAQAKTTDSLPGRNGETQQCAAGTMWNAATSEFATECWAECQAGRRLQVRPMGYCGVPPGQLPSDCCCARPTEVGRAGRRSQRRDLLWLQPGCAMRRNAVGQRAAVPRSALQNCLFTHELQWQSRGTRANLTGWLGRPTGRLRHSGVPGAITLPVRYAILPLDCLCNAGVNTRLTPLHYWLFTPELQWQRRGTTANLTGERRNTGGDSKGISVRIYTHCV